jgi:hypothetical protein
MLSLGRLHISYLEEVKDRFAAVAVGHLEIGSTRFGPVPYVRDCLLTGRHYRSVSRR